MWHGVGTVFTHAFVRWDTRTVRTGQEFDFLCVASYEHTVHVATQRECDPISRRPWLLLLPPERRGRRISLLFSSFPFPPAPLVVVSFSTHD